MESNEKDYSKYIKLLFGLLVLLLGVTFFLAYWEDIIALCRAMLAIVMIVVGFGVLYSLKK